MADVKEFPSCNTIITRYNFSTLIESFSRFILPTMNFYGKYNGGDDSSMRGSCFTDGDDRSDSDGTDQIVLANDLQHRTTWDTSDHSCDVADNKDNKKDFCDNGDATVETHCTEKTLDECFESFFTAISTIVRTMHGRLQDKQEELQVAGERAIQLKTVVDEERDCTLSKMQNAVHFINDFR